MAIELKTFVEESLKQIIDGVTAAQEHAMEQRALVNPVGLYMPSAKQPFGVWEIHASSVRTAQSVEFDVAISANEDSQASGGIGVFVGAFGIGSKGQTGESSSSMSRIRFSVPLSLPQQSVPNDRAG